MKILFSELVDIYVLIHIDRVWIKSLYYNDYIKANPYIIELLFTKYYEITFLKDNISILILDLFLFLLTEQNILFELSYFSVTRVFLIFTPTICR